MKNIIKAISLFIILSLGLFSCKTASIMKRHYNKGYYISKKHEPSEIKIPEKITNNQTISSPANKEVLAKIDAPEFKNDIVLKDVSTAETNRAKKEILSENKTKNTTSSFHPKNSINEIIGMPHQLKQALTKDTPARDALSLLWILILVLLIVYVIGLLFDLFGLGPVFHILGIIILVLLILWLLRVI